MLCELTRESRELDCSVSAGLHLSRQSLGQIRRQRTWGNALSVHDTPEASDACPVIPDRPGAVVVVGEALDEGFEIGFDAGLGLASHRHSP